LNQAHLEEIETLENKFNKDIFDVSKARDDYKSQLDEMIRNKQEMQDNLKKAFLKGVESMNMEAMQAIQSNPNGP
jgi:flagellar biosynthesis chaperone FliJ